MPWNFQNYSRKTKKKNLKLLREGGPVQNNGKKTQLILNAYFYQIFVIVKQSINLSSTKVPPISRTKMNRPMVIFKGLWKTQQKILLQTIHNFLYQKSNPTTSKSLEKYLLL